MDLIKRILTGFLFNAVSITTIIIFIFWLPIGYVLKKVYDPMKINFTKN